MLNYGYLIYQAERVKTQPERPRRLDAQLGSSFRSIRPVAPSTHQASAPCAARQVRTSRVCGRACQPITWSCLPEPVGTLGLSADAMVDEEQATGIVAVLHPREAGVVVAPERG